jgi:hypothetical protein
MLRGTDLERLTKPCATHSIYFDALSEHGWVGLFLFVMILGYMNCSWLARRSRHRPEIAWANFVGRMGQAVLVAYATAVAFASQAYLDEYWCMIFIFDPARRQVSKQIAPTGAFGPSARSALRCRSAPSALRRLQSPQCDGVCANRPMVSLVMTV